MFFVSDPPGLKLDDIELSERQPWPPQPKPPPPGIPTAPKATANMPVFDNNLVTNISAQLGGTAFLHCRVRNLAERTVSLVCYTEKNIY